MALVDDHQLFRKGIADLINDFRGFTVVLEAGNGNELQKLLTEISAPDIIIMDVNMPGMNGFDCMH